MPRKKILYIAVSVLSLLTLTACGNQSEKEKVSSSCKQKTSKVAKSTKKHSNKTSESNAVDTTEKTTMAESQSSATKSNEKPVAKTMDLSQIKDGNYTSIRGTWHQIRYGRNHVPGKTGVQWEDGGDAKLYVFEDVLVGKELAMSKRAFASGNDITQSLVFSEENGSLVGSLADPSVVRNMSITFYPKGSVTKFNNEGTPETASQDLIAVWTSGNSYTQVFALESSNADSNGADVNVEQIANNNFTSLVGTWKTKAGKTLVVENSLAIREAGPGQNHAVPAGVNVTIDGNPEMISNGELSNGYIKAVLGTRMDQPAAGGAGAFIVPKGVSFEYATDDDTSKDRIFMGQSVDMKDVYYRVD